LKGYIRKIGTSDALHAEMWGMCMGMEMASRKCFSQLIVESDSEVLVDMVSGSSNISEITPILI